MTANLTDKEFVATLNKKQKEVLLDVQMSLFNDGYAKDADFVQAECWKKAVQEIRKRYEGKCNN